MTEYRAVLLGVMSGFLEWLILHALPDDGYFDESTMKGRVLTVVTWPLLCAHMLIVLVVACILYLPLRLTVYIWLGPGEWEK